MKKTVCMFLMLLSLDSYSVELKVAYICTTEASIGFRFEQGKWITSQFTEKDFLIRKLKEEDPGFNNHNETPYGVFELDETIPNMFCKVQKTLFLCEGLGQLEFLARTGRFMRTNTFDYLSAEEDERVKPRIIRGTCKPLPAGYKEPPKKVNPPIL